MKNNKIILIVALAALTLTACKQKTEPVTETVTTEQEQSPQSVFDGVNDNDNLELVPPQTVPARSTATHTSQAATSSQAKSTRNYNGKAETIYVETDGAQGRVWGHVTMKGDRGTGTIHDWDENTLAVSVTRHGDELFAIDQNSRQYVFKLKQNKTQE